jgi:hypothetical protein
MLSRSGVAELSVSAEKENEDQNEGDDPDGRFHDDARIQAFQALGRSDRSGSETMR